MKTEDIHIENSIEFVFQTPWDRSWHAHADSNELVFVRKGRIETRIADHVLTAEPGGILFYPRNTAHQPSATGSKEVKYQAIRWYGAPSPLIPEEPVAAFDRSGRLLLLAEWIHQVWPPMDRAISDLALTWLAAILKEFRLLLNPRTYPWVEQIESEIRRRIADPITLDDLARIAGMSKFHLTRKFKSVKGLSPAQYITRLRVEQAKGLLLHTEKPIEAIAEEVGFCDASHLSRHFRNHFNENPGAFRNRAAESVPAQS